MIVITTPTGNIGHHVVQHLLAAGEPLRLIVRNANSLSSAIRNQVEIVEGSHGDEATVYKAFEGASAVFWLCPPTPSVTPAAATVDFASNGAAAIRRHGVSHVVAVTTLGRDTPWQNRAGNATGSIQMVNLLRETGSAVRGLALPAFMDNALRQIDSIRLGKMFGPIDPDKKLPHTATRDASAVAAQWLMDRSWSGQEDIPVLGPEDLSYNDLAQIISEVTGRDVRYEHQSYEAYKSVAMTRGMTDAFAQGFVDMLRAKEEGMDNMASQANPVVGPTSFRQWVEQALVPAIPQ